MASNLSGSKGEQHRADGDGGDSLRRRDSGRASVGVAGPVDFSNWTKLVVVDDDAVFSGRISWGVQPVENYRQGAVVVAAAGEGRQERQFPRQGPRENLQQGVVVAVADRRVVRWSVTRDLDKRVEQRGCRFSGF